MLETELLETVCGEWVASRPATALMRAILLGLSAMNLEILGAPEALAVPSPPPAGGSGRGRPGLRVTFPPAKNLSTGMVAPSLSGLGLIGWEW